MTPMTVAESTVAKSKVKGETVQLAEYAFALRYDDIPPDVIAAAKNTIADGIACCVFGYRFPWSQALVRYAQKNGRAGKSVVLGPGAPLLAPPFAALVNGALAHSFELDAGTQRGVGAHPYGTAFTGALSVAQDIGASGRALLTAFIAGSEVMLRIGRATGRSNEQRGFHAPGTTGPFGSAVACSLLLGLETERLLDALGIAGSVASGLRQFAFAAEGGMVKRLHFGRGAEGGVLAALLAAEGFDGPHNVLEGKNGFLRVFCDEYDVSELTLGLDHSIFRVREIAMKRFGTHGTSQLPLQALLELRAQHPFSADEIESIHISAAAENVAHHDNLAPADLMQAQYSVPFCMAVGCLRDIRDPRAIDETALTDPAIQAVIKRIRYEAGAITDKRACALTVTLKNGAVHRHALPAPGVDWRPANRDETYEKYSILMRDCPRARTDDLFERIQTLEDQPDLGWLRI